MSKRLTTEEFIERSNKIHENTYNYTNVNYVGARTKVEIICPIHGSFFQMPVSHLSGTGCQKCAGNILSNKEEFIKKSNKKHYFKYDYTRVSYITNKIKVEILCKEHGSFYQTPNKHLQGKGCPVCGGTAKSSTGNFIERANMVHNFKYDYSRVNYINTETKVEIICPIHGSFYQTPHSHLVGKGCDKCSGRCLSNTKEFIERSNLAHNFKYNYSKVNYINNGTKVEIICSIHGSFFQTPHMHLRGAGCPLCNTSKAEIFISKYLTEKEIPFTYQYSILKNPKTNCYLPFDFYIPHLNLLLEFDGEFHFRKVHKSHNFQKQKLHDRYKNIWAYHNGYNLIRISYKENLEQRLNEIFNKGTH
jgi:hypothetical protein